MDDGPASSHNKTAELLERVWACSSHITALDPS